jgi:hypothetical protein
MHPMKIHVLLTLVVASGLTAVAAVRAQPDEMRVLFIGNSLTSVNDVPRLVEGLTARGGTRIKTATVARNNFSLDDHWLDGEARRAIERGGWSFVVLQQGPSALPDSRVQLRASVKQFDPVIRKAGARTALYMVWPSLARKNDFDRVRESHVLAAADVDGLFIPAGEAWRAATRRDASLLLYGDDGFHPTPLASYLSAMVIASALTGREPASLGTRPQGWPETLLPPERARVLQEAAQEVLRPTSRF